MSSIKDFRNTVYIIWQHLGLPEPTWLQYDMAEWMDRGPKRAFIAGFRGVAKSYLASAFTIHTLVQDPQKKILVISATQTRADEFVQFTKRLIDEIEIFRHLRARPEQRDSRVGFDVGPAKAAHVPSVKSVGVFGQMTGSRADLIIPDDIEIPNNSATQLQREKLLQATKEFSSILKPKGRIMYLGTYQSRDSIYTKLPEQGYQVRVWPARYPTKEQQANYQEFLAPSLEAKLKEQPELEGKPTDPVRFDEIDLMEREFEKGRSDFALQFMLDTSLMDADKHPLKLSDCSVTDLDPEVAHEKVVWASREVIEGLPNVGFGGDRWHKPMALLGGMIPYQGCVLAIDPSGRGKDETGYAAVAYLNGHLFLLEAGGFKEGYTEETLWNLAQVAKRCKATKVVPEANYGGGMFSELFKPVLAQVWPCTIEEAPWSNVQKEKRIIDTLEPVLQQHRLTVNTKVIKQDCRLEEDGTITSPEYQLFYQLTRITRDKGSLRHDDRLDALALGVQHWTESMARDANRAMADRREELLQAELEAFIGISISKDTWFDSTLRKLPA